MSSSNGAVLVCGAAAATTFVVGAVHDIEGGAWPRWLDLINAGAIVVALVALLAAGWARLKLRRLRAVTEDERTAHTHLQSCAAALFAAIAVQMPFLFRVDVPSMAQAKFTIAASMSAYGIARLWFNRDA